MVLVDIKFRKCSDGGYFASYKHKMLTQDEWVDEGIRIFKDPEDGLWHFIGSGVDGYKNRKAAVRALLAKRWNDEADSLTIPFDTYFRNYSRGERGRRMSGDLANRIYDILVEHCGASDDGRSYDRESFVHHHSGDISSDEAYRCHEYRFGGYLGFGGKFWNEGNRFRVSAYSEDSSADVRVMVARANQKLQALYQETWPYVP